MTSARTATAPASIPVADVVTKLSCVPLGTAAREMARLRLADTAFAMLIGTRTEQGGSSVRLAEGLYGRRSVAGTAFRLTAACRMTEIDDVDLLSCVTPGSVVVPTVLAVLASSDSGRGRAASDFAVEQALDVIARGYEVALGLGEAMRGPQRLRHGVWPTLAVGAVTAAAVTTLLLGGSADHVQAASVFAAQQSIQANPAGNAREAFLAGAVVTGMTAALAVRHGMSVAGRNMDGALGGLLAEDVEIGDEPRILRPCIKSFCSARQAMTAVTAVRALVDEHGLSVPDIERIIVEVPTEYSAMLDKPSVTSRRESLSSVQYQLALAVAHPDGLLDVDRSRLHNDGAVGDLMQRVHVRGSAELSGRYPAQWPARVQIVTRGSMVEALLDEVPGERDFSAKTLTDKFQSFSRFSHGLSADAEKLWRSSHQAASPDDLAALVALIGGEQLSRPSSRRSSTS